ncbi:50S ribosomal protein L17 [Robiginitalea sp. 2V75]|uniref:Large ribosomal subunit protein bL17 n=1 Tax=Robiginitalea marina TaxID=2954105 RepID=A0ABT1B024_9FLAO|nr:50S ribosomal protein L17 [Robiginitalea marina]MCO5725257.1 50S ribosomal protein L17 [Robiginitalea marina]
MRHGKKVNHLGRKAAHRRSMMANMACSLIEHKRINTTLAKAKALKQFVEPLLTRSKAENNQTAEKGTHNRRIAFSNLRSKEAVTELFSTVAEKIGDRPGGYTRIIKLGNRLGDNAEMAMIELVDFNEIYNAGKAKKKTTRRSRRSKGKSEEAAPAAPGKPAKAAPEETVEAVAEAEAVTVEETGVEEAGVEETQAEAAPQESEDEVKKDDAEA